MQYTNFIIGAIISTLVLVSYIIHPKDDPIFFVDEDVEEENEFKKLLNF